MRRALTWQLIIGAAIIGGWIFLGLAAPLLTNVDPLKSTTLIIDGPRSVLAPYDPGTYGYPLGSDRNGRDLWAGVMYGARATLTIAFVAVDEELGADYVRTARSKGLLERVVIGRHALRNALVPILGAIAAALSIGLSTLPVVEVFFSWPGLGFSLLQAIQRFDAATAGTLLGALVVTIAIIRFALDAAAARLVHASTGAVS